MNRKLQHFIAGLLLLLQACASVNIASNKQEGYTKKPRKIYIVTYCSKESMEYGSSITKGITADFIKRGIETEYYIKTPLSLDTEADINQKIVDFKPEAVLYLRQTVSGWSKGAYEISLFDTELRKNVWKSEINTSHDEYTSEMDVSDKTVKIVADKLLADKLL
ncbi:hypothetical protein [Mucilaginibacter defluvii]